MLQALDDLGLIEPDDKPIGSTLAGGVSSDIWRIELDSGLVCAKRALPKLKVAQDWYAPVERAGHEAMFNRIVFNLWPKRVPRLIGFHTPTGTLVSEYFALDEHPIWKQQLRHGRSQPKFAAMVANFLTDLYHETKDSMPIKEQFYAPDMIHALRLEPYFLVTAKRHPTLAPALCGLSEMFQSNCVSLIHGDFSPKNILVGSNGPIILDAECANFGDPAFDAAFCLNHLCLKALWTPKQIPIFKASADAFLEIYKKELQSTELLRRVSAYLPGLMLARVDGKSPVEYLVAADDIQFLRDYAIRQLRALRDDPQALINDWFETAANREAA